MIFTEEKDPVFQLVQKRAVLADCGPLMEWDAFYSKNVHHLPGQKGASAFVANLIIALVAATNLVLIALGSALFLSPSHPEKKSSYQSVNSVSSFIAQLQKPYGTPELSSKDLGLNPETTFPKPEQKSRSFREASKTAKSKITLDTDVISEKISAYFDQLRGENPSSAAENYLKTLLRVKDSLDRKYQQQINEHLAIDFGIIHNKGHHYAEYLEPDDFIKASKEKNAVVVDLRSVQAYEKNHLRQALSVEFNLQNLEIFSQEISRSKAVFVYGDNMQECESAKAYLWKKGFPTVYILNQPFNPSLFKKTELATSGH
ncbi:MAG: rhodanese-like domain-containing protein [Flavobacteriales bacterium]|nr:rhodanese-like domain-containing protein [Flavobacteriales bacterium]MDW8431541.1 rhodanese-like domain-containing protein [Flavobacteriales bacterium]